MALWALVDESLVQLGVSEWPLISLSLGVAGACAIVTTGTLLARAKWLDFVRFCGEGSIVIYLAFFLPMAATRTLLLRTGLIHDVGVMSLTVTLVALFGALAIWQAAIRFGAHFLFERRAPSLPGRDPERIGALEQEVRPEPGRGLPDRQRAEQRHQRDRQRHHADVVDEASGRSSVRVAAIGRKKAR